MEILGIIVFIFIFLFFVGLIGKILGFVFSIIQWVFSGCGNVFGCFLWIIAILIAIMIV